MGVKCALELARRDNNVRIRLVSDRPNFEYHGALYRLVAGGSPLEVCLPLRDIFDGLDVDVVVDRVTTIDRTNHMVIGASGSTYVYDYLVLGLGAETNYFGIPGLAEHSLGMKTIGDALELKRHITDTLSLCPTKSLPDQQHVLRFVIVGAGATGVELAGELAGYIHHLVRRHDLDPNMVAIDLVERGDRILGNMCEDVSHNIHERLEQLGVNVLCNTSIESLENDQVVLSGETVHSPTVVWTAGVTANKLMNQLDGPQDRMGRIGVNEYLQLPNQEHIFVGGDCAGTEHSGMAQTAIAHGAYIAHTINRLVTNSDTAVPPYQVKKPIYAIPAGPGWAGIEWGRHCFYGRLGWIIRRWLDWKVFRNLLPFSRALGAFRSHYQSEHPHEIC